MKRYNKEKIKTIKNYQSTMRVFLLSPSEYSGKRVAIARSRLIKLNISIKEACLY